MRSFESIREEIIDEEELEQWQFDIEVGKIYYMGGYEDWKVAQLGTVEGTDGYPKHLVTMIRLHDNQLRTILQSTFNRKFNKEL